MRSYLQQVSGLQTPRTLTHPAAHPPNISYLRQSIELLPIPDLAEPTKRLLPSITHATPTMRRVSSQTQALTHRIDAAPPNHNLPFRAMPLAPSSNNQHGHHIPPISVVAWLPLCMDVKWASRRTQLSDTGSTPRWSCLTSPVLHDRAVAALRERRVGHSSIQAQG